jgi:hypothetical protein
MADYFMAEIKIGGEINEEVLSEMFEIIERHHSYVDDLPENFEDFKLFANQSIRRSGYIELSNDRTPWGEFQNLENFLFENKIPFIRISGPFHDNPETRVTYNPAINANVFTEILVAGKEILFKYELAEILEMLKTGQKDKAEKRFEYLLKSGINIPMAKI